MASKARVRNGKLKCKLFLQNKWWLNKELCYIRLETNSSAASLRNSVTRKYSRISTIRRLQNWPFVRAEQYVENKTLILQGTESVGPSLGDPLLARYIQALLYFLVFELVPSEFLLVFCSSFLGNLVWINYYQTVTWTSWVSKESLLRL